MDAATLARQVGESMFAADAASREFMRMELVTCEPGRAVMRMTVREPMLNGHKICHGGFIFTLADSTFAFACNSHNKVTVAAGCSIEFLKPGQLGAFVATSKLISCDHRYGETSAELHDAEGTLVATVTAKLRIIPRRIQAQRNAEAD